MIRYRFPAMGNQIMVFLDSKKESHKVEIAQTREWFQEWEQILSRFRSDSELSQVNQRAGQPTQVSETYWQVFQASLAAYRLSDRLITPTILPALEAAGYTQSFDDMPQQVALPKNQPQPITDLRRITLDTKQHTIQLPAGTKLDFGGVGKGWAAHQAMLRLQHLGPVLVDAGGDIAVSAPRRDGRPWFIGVADPLNDLRDLDKLSIARGGIATSGRDRHHWLQNGAPRHHLIDPRTGRPAETDVLSTTVVAADVIAAETASKTVLILGSHVGLTWLEKQPDMYGLAVLEDGTVIYSKTFQHAARSLA